MSDQSLATLLAWLREESRMLGWDMIIAVERDKANLLLRHDYMARFDRGEYLEPISGSEEIVGNYWRGVLHDFVFDTPRLMFQTVAAPTLEDPSRRRTEALLTMDLMSGTLVSMENESVVWRASKIQSFDTLQANKLYLHLDMPQTLAVQPDGAIKLDFRFAEGFEMALTGDADFNDQVSVAFRTLFHALEDARRMYPLLVIPEGVDASLRPQTVMLHSQVNPDASLERGAASMGSGALVALASLDSALGALPGEDYKYLIPDDADKGYSALVMLQRRGTLLAIDVGWQLLKLMVQSLGITDPIEERFEIEGDPSLDNWSATNRRWAMPISVPDDVLEEFTFSYWNTMWIHFGIQVSQTGPESYFLRLKNAATDHRVASYVTDFYNGSAVSRQMYCDIDYSVSYELSKATNTFNLIADNYANNSGPLTWQSIDRTPPAWTGDPELIVNYDRMLNTANGWQHPNIYEHVLEYTRREAASLLTLGDSLFPPVWDLVRNSFDTSFETQSIYSPLDFACFGSINPDRTSFEITPHELIIAPGQPYTFASTAPDNVVWAASNIDPTSSAPPGGFGPGSTYWAPPLVSVKGNHTRVRVSATQGDATAHALITVAQPLSINPLVATCEADMSGGTQGGNDHIVELFAALMQEERARITWTIKNPIESESGCLEPSEDGHTCTFTAHPYVKDKNYVLDEVEVKVEIDEGGQIVTRTRQALILASHVGFTLNIHIAEARLAPDTLTFIARMADTEGNQVDAKWRLAAQSPGLIGSEDGIYVPDPERPEKFALIFAAAEGRFKPEGYLILPLPYLDFPEELILFSQPLDLTEITVTPTG